MNSLTRDRALTLLGQGLGPEMVAAAVGVSTSAISQLISDPEFSARVAELRFQNLAEHSSRDKKYDSLEDRLIEKLENMLSFMVRPMEVLKAISVINAAKRRGVSNPEHITGQQQTISLSLPSHLLGIYASNSNIQVNIHNQVIKAGDQELITIQSGRLDSLSKEHKNVVPPAKTNLIPHSNPAAH